MVCRQTHHQSTSEEVDLTSSNRNKHRKATSSWCLLAPHRGSKMRKQQAVQPSRPQQHTQPRATTVLPKWSGSGESRPSYPNGGSSLPKSRSSEMTSASFHRKSHGHVVERRYPVSEECPSYLEDEAQIMTARTPSSCYSVSLDSAEDMHPSMPVTVRGWPPVYTEWKPEPQCCLSSCSGASTPPSTVTSSSSYISSRQRRSRFKRRRFGQRLRDPGGHRRDPGVRLVVCGSPSRRRRLRRRRVRTEPESEGDAEPLSLTRALSLALASTKDRSRPLPIKGGNEEETQLIRELHNLFISLQQNRRECVEEILRLRQQVEAFCSSSQTPATQRTQSTAEPVDDDVGKFASKAGGTGVNWLEEARVVADELQRASAEKRIVDKEMRSSEIKVMMQASSDVAGGDGAPAAQNGPIRHERMEATVAETESDNSSSQSPASDRHVAPRSSPVESLSEAEEVANTPDVDTPTPNTESPELSLDKTGLLMLETGHSASDLSTTHSSAAAAATAACLIKTNSLTDRILFFEKQARKDTSLPPIARNNRPARVRIVSNGVVQPTTAAQENTSPSFDQINSMYNRIKRRYNPWPANSSCSESEQHPEEQSQAANTSNAPIVPIPPSPEPPLRNIDDEVDARVASLAAAAAQTTTVSNHVTIEEDISSSWPASPNSRRLTPNFGSSSSSNQHSRSSSPHKNEGLYSVRFGEEVERGLRQAEQNNAVQSTVSCESTEDEHTREMRRRREKALRSEINRLRSQVVLLKGQVSKEVQALRGGGGGRAIKAVH